MNGNGDVNGKVNPFKGSYLEEVFALPVDQLLVEQQEAQEGFVEVGPMSEFERRLDHYFNTFTDRLQAVTNKAEAFCAACHEQNLDVVRHAAPGGCQELEQFEPKFDELKMTKSSVMVLRDWFWFLVKNRLRQAGVLPEEHDVDYELSIIADKIFYGNGAPLEKTMPVLNGDGDPLAYTSLKEVFDLPLDELIDEFAEAAGEGETIVGDMSELETRLFYRMRTLSKQLKENGIYSDKWAARELTALKPVFWDLMERRLAAAGALPADYAETAVTVGVRAGGKIVTFVDQEAARLITLEMGFKSLFGQIITL